MWGIMNRPSITGMKYTQRDLRQQLARAQHVVMDLQYEVHYLNNQLHPILSKEDEDPEMLVEDDDQEEEEVEPKNEDDPISDLGSDLNDDQGLLATSMITRCEPDK